MGGTRVKAGVLAGTELVAFDVAPADQDPLDTTTLLGRSLLLAHGDVHCIGMSVPGLIENSVVMELPGKHAPIVGRDLREYTTSTFGIDSFAINDAVAYGIGEAVLGSGRGATRVVVVTIGTGVGVAAIFDGQPVTSGRWGGGILGGQIPIAETSEHCDSNGQRGTIEALCAAQRIVDASSGAFASVPEVFVAFADGDVRARNAMESYQKSLVRALVALAHAHAPEVIVVGGGPLGEGSPLLEGIEDRVNDKLFAGYSVHVRRAALGDNAALMGLAHLAQQL